MLIIKLDFLFLLFSLQKLLVFQTKNFGKKTKFGVGEPKISLIILDKSILTCPMWLGRSFLLAE